MSSSTQVRILPPGGLADEVSDAPAALFLHLSSVFSHTPAHEGARAHMQPRRFSVMWLVECKISSLQLEQNRFGKIPFAERGASEAWSGMAEHGTARLLPSAHQLTAYLHGPRGAYLQSAQWP